MTAVFDIGSTVLEISGIGSTSSEILLLVSL